MKFLFYSDFTFYRDYHRTISNEKYFKLPNGPCPDRWERYLVELMEKGFIRKKTRKFTREDGSLGGGDYYELAEGIYNDDLFSPEEILRMKKVYEELSIYSATRLSQMSHDEVAYIEAQDLSEIDKENAYFISLLEDYEEDEDYLVPEVREAISELETSGVL
jgi:hypothetical protein